MYLNVKEKKDNVLKIKPSSFGTIGLTQMLRNAQLIPTFLSALSWNTSKEEKVFMSPGTRY